MGKRTAIAWNTKRLSKKKYQYELHNLTGRSVKFDVVAVDSKGKQYDIEVQRADSGAEPKRATDLQRGKFDMCVECYTNQRRATPLLKPVDCLKNHTQYICGTCGRCICIECDPKRGLQRWNFPFKSLKIAKLYLRTADYTMKKSCGIYEIKSSSGRISYKIFASPIDLQFFLQKNKEKVCEKMAPIFITGDYIEYSNTQVRKLNANEVTRYMSER